MKPGPKPQADLDRDWMLQFVFVMVEAKRGVCGSVSGACTHLVPLLAKRGLRASKSRLEAYYYEARQRGKRDPHFWHATKYDIGRIRREMHAHGCRDPLRFWFFPQE